MSELLLCPFCGGEADYQMFGGYGANASIGRAICSCGAEMRQSKMQTEEELTEAWNTRAERTCTMKKVNWDDGQCTWGCKCDSCGHRFEHEFGTTWNYCPCCGAKVVSE